MNQGPNADIEAPDAPTERDFICPCGHGLQAHTWTGCQAYVPPTIGRAGACCTRTPPEVVLASDWLAERDRVVAKKAWDEGRTAGHRELRPVNAFGDTESARNPYRTTPEGEAR